MRATGGGERAALDDPPVYSNQETQPFLAEAAPRATATGLADTTASRRGLTWPRCTGRRGPRRTSDAGLRDSSARACCCARPTRRGQWGDSRGLAGQCVRAGRRNGRAGTGGAGEPLRGATPVNDGRAAKSAHTARAPRTRSGGHGIDGHARRQGGFAAWLCDFPALRDRLVDAAPARARSAARGPGASTSAAGSTAVCSRRRTFRLRGISHRRGASAWDSPRPSPRACPRADRPPDYETRVAPRLLPGVASPPGRSGQNHRFLSRASSRRRSDPVALRRPRPTMPPMPRKPKAFPPNPIVTPPHVHRVPLHVKGRSRRPQCRKAKYG